MASFAPAMFVDLSCLMVYHENRRKYSKKLYRKHMKIAPENARGTKFHTPPACKSKLHGETKQRCLEITVKVETTVREHDLLAYL